MPALLRRSPACLHTPAATSAALAWPCLQVCRCCVVAACMHAQRTRCLPPHSNHQPASKNLVLTLSMQFQKPKKKKERKLKKKALTEEELAALEAEAAARGEPHLSVVVWGFRLVARADC